MGEGPDDQMTSITQRLQLERIPGDGMETVSHHKLLFHGFGSPTTVVLGGVVKQYYTI